MILTSRLLHLPGKQGGIVKHSTKALSSWFPWWKPVTLQIPRKRSLGNRLQRAGCLSERLSHQIWFRHSPDCEFTEAAWARAGLHVQELMWQQKQWSSLCEHVSRRQVGGGGKSWSQVASTTGGGPSNHKLTVEDLDFHWSEHWGGGGNEISWNREKGSQHKE